MKILGIETSCDDTCVALIRVRERGAKDKSFEILSNVISSQVKLHAQYGGVYPFLAKREHLKNLPIVFKKATEKIKKFDLIGVVNGPGLEPCLWVGVNFAKDLAKKLNLPLLAINHIEAHILANFIKVRSKRQKAKGNIFPAICLVVSGGHSQLILMEEIGKYKILGETRDDAAGECFDKTARILGLDYPGGPAIAKEAKKLKKKTLLKKFSIKLPRPMIHQKNFDFSFSGLKTAVLYHWKNQPKKIRNSKEYIRAMAFEIQEAIIEVLVKKTIRATKEYKAKSIFLGGGVAANERLRREFKKAIKKEKLNVNLFYPPQKFCTDNGVMVALCAYFSWLRGKRKNWKKVEANANLKIG